MQTYSSNAKRVRKILEIFHVCKHLFIILPELSDDMESAWVSEAMLAGPMWQEQIYKKEKFT